MSTRGCYGFYRNGKDKIVYNHQDSYPEGLGKKIFWFVRDHTDKELKSLCDSIEVLDDEKDLPETDGKASFWELGISNDGLLFIEDSSTYLGDSLNCEWGYVINLDDGILEIYKGRQKESQDNRYVDYTHASRMGYHNCKLQNTFKLDHIRLLRDEDIPVVLEQVRTEEIG